MITVGVLVSASYLPVWQADLLRVVAALPEVVVELIPIDTHSRTGKLWHRIKSTTGALIAYRGNLDFVRRISPQTLHERDIVLDLCDLSQDAAEHIFPARLGRWRLIDQQGRSISEPFPGIEAITKELGGEISLISERQQETVVLNDARFVAGPRYEETFARHYALAVQLVCRAISDIASLENTAAPYIRRIPATIGDIKACTYLIRGRLHAVKRKVRSLIYSESWMVGWIDRPIADLLSLATPPDIHWLGSRMMSRYLADPFGVPGTADRFYCEELNERTNTGCIKEIIIKDGRLSSEKKVELGIGGHVSYPYLFRVGEETYCIPESEASRRCQVLVMDPERGWRPLVTIFDDVAAADPTIFQWEGRFWLAYTDSDQSPHDNLHLCYADQLVGPWTHHRHNPVKIDSRSSRSGGTPFVVDGVLFRPAQDCAMTYGGATVFNRIVTCTPSRYEEQVVRVLKPSRSGLNPHGMHTVSAWEGRTLLDGKREIINPVVLLRKLSRRWSNLKMYLAKESNGAA